MNLDDQNVVMALCAPGAAVYTVTYVVEDDTITWQLPAGAPLEGIVVEPASGGTIAGWYMDSEHDTQLAYIVNTITDIGKEMERPRQIFLPPLPERMADTTEWRN